jgi:hypothetical protein
MLPGIDGAEVGRCGLPGWIGVGGSQCLLWASRRFQVRRLSGGTGGFWPCSLSAGAA